MITVAVATKNAGALDVDGPKLPGLIFSHRFAIVSCLFALLLVAYLLFKWNWVCVNAQAWVHVKRMCDLYESGQAVGSICAPLCTNNAIHTVQCHSFKSTKEAVFSAEWHQTRLVFKTSSSSVQDLHWFDNGVIKYPSENEFLTTIRAVVSSKLNVTLNQESLQRLSRLKPMYIERDLKRRHLELENIWTLIQDNEFLLSSLFAERDIFPQLLGTCGPYFAVEYLEPILRTSSLMAHSILSVDDNKNAWAARLRAAIQIYELVDELESTFQEPLHLCDVKLDHFAAVKDGSRVKFIDLIGIYPKSILDGIFKDITCVADSDCEYLDCRARCDKRAGRCGEVSNENLQIVCEKIFLGWRFNGRVMVDGLLMGPHTPSDLAAVLRQCANPQHEEGVARARGAPDEETRRRLYNILIEIEQTVSSDFY